MQGSVQQVWALVCAGCFLGAIFGYLSWQWPIGVLIAGVILYLLQRIR